MRLIYNTMWMERKFEIWHTITITGMFQNYPDSFRCEFHRQSFINIWLKISNSNDKIIFLMFVLDILYLKAFMYKHLKCFVCYISLISVSHFVIFPFSLMKRSCFPLFFLLCALLALALQFDSFDWFLQIRLSERRSCIFVRSRCNIANFGKKIFPARGDLEDDAS